MIPTLLHFVLPLVSLFPWFFRQRDFKWKVFSLVFLVLSPSLLTMLYLPEIIVVLTLIPHFKKGHKVFA